MHHSTLPDFLVQMANGFPFPVLIGGLIIGCYRIHKTEKRKKKIELEKSQKSESADLRN
ncbi:MAG: hypothetical protein WCO35_00555 [Candidatus Nomurabacteria bacterium]